MNKLVPLTTPAAATGVALQRKCRCGGACDGCRYDAARRPDVPPIVPETLRSAGEPLDERTKLHFSRRMGRDFSRVASSTAIPQRLSVGEPSDPFEREADRFAAAVDDRPPLQASADLSGVRIHRDARAAESARAIHARAYTVGSHIAFGAGEFAPHTRAGRQLLAHELAHAGQQSAGVVRRTVTVNAPNDPAPTRAASPPGGSLTDAVVTNADLITGYARRICPGTYWLVDSAGTLGSPFRDNFCRTPARGQSGAVSSTTPEGCSCLCAATAPGVNNRITVTSLFHSSSGDVDVNAAGGGVTEGATPGARDVDVAVSGSGGTVEGTGETDRRRAQFGELRDPPWMVFAHEICGHAMGGRGSGRYASMHIQTPGGRQSAIDVENRIRREQSSTVDNLGVRKGRFYGPETEPDSDTLRGHDGSAYVVGAGETLASIARRVGYSPAEARDHIFFSGGPEMANDEARRIGASQGVSAGQNLLIEGVFWHDVIDGETLESIATQWHVDIGMLRNANRGVRNPPGVGQRLLIPVAAPMLPPDRPGEATV